MPYPNDIDKFTEKLNKSEAVYVIEEEVTPVDGIYEAMIKHDNVVDSSINVYTGSKLTGVRIDNFIVSIPSETNWKRSIKIFSNAQKLYITYETYGDQVEAEDINRLQESVVATQTEVERFKEETDERLKAVSDAGKGDMLKSVYDTNGDGVVDEAESVAWLGVSGKPSTYPPSTHEHTISDVVGLRAELDGLFQFADSGKSGTASVVGSPATVNDTWEQLITHIQNAKNIMAAPLGISNTSSLSSMASTLNMRRNSIATAVNAKGVAASPSDTFATLATKIGQISTGVKYASGSFSGGVRVNTDNVVATGLAFKPKYLLLSINNPSTNYSQFVVVLLAQNVYLLVSAATTGTGAGYRVNNGVSWDNSTGTVTLTDSPSNMTSLNSWQAYE